MSITSHISEDGREITIYIKGRFDFNSHQEFRQHCESVKHPGVKYVIDMSGAEYMDSSALGMLLLLREQAGNDNANIDIVQCRPEIRQILEIAHFNQLFRIH